MKPQTKLTKRQYLKNCPTEVEEQNSCPICSDIIVNPVICHGTCKRKYCRRCATIWISFNNSCPLKCSDPWKVEITQPTLLAFNCPYNQTCVINSAEEFESHIEKCEFLSQGQKQGFRIKNSYLCREGHPLEFYIASYKRMSESNCVACDESSLSRSFCPKCDEFYCVRCRVPQASRSHCPIGHPFKRLEPEQLNNYVCDICGMRPVWLSKGLSDDSLCNFGVCDVCLETLPEKLSTLPIDHQVHCKNSHPLTHLASASMGTCANCQRTKFCYKQCQECKYTYCLNCKPFQIFRKQCQLKHPFERLEAQNPTKCNFCQQEITTTIYKDSKCGIEACQECFNQQNQKSATKLRTKKAHICDKEHCLQIFIGVPELFRKCMMCQQQCVLQYFCNTCPYTKFFCYRCKPFSVGDGCLFKDKMNPLVLGQESEELRCMFCQKMGKNHMNCKYCKLRVCQQCYDKDQ